MESKVKTEASLCKQANSWFAFKLHKYTFLSAAQIKCQLIHSKLGVNVVLTANRFDQDETLSYSASHPDSSCLHIKL